MKTQRSLPVVALASLAAVALGGPATASADVLPQFTPPSVHRGCPRSRRHCTAGRT